MRVPRLAAGVVCLGLAAAAGWWGWYHRAWQEKVRGTDPQTLKAADLAANGPRDTHAVRLTNVELGEPILIPRGPNESPDVWFAVYPARPGRPKGLPTGTPKVLYHTRHSLASREAADLLRKNSEVSGTVMNGLPSASLDLPAEVTAAFPNLDPATVWQVRGDRVWQEGVIYWTAALAVTLGLLGLWLAAGGLFGTPGKRRARETRSLPELRPLDAKTAPRAKRAYYHPKCGTNTLASGDDLVRLECPFRGCSGTYCCGCGGFVPLAAVRWEDTGEGLVEYRARIGGAVPFWKRVRLSWLGTAYEGAVNLGLDADGRVVQPLRDPPGWPRPSPAFRPVAARR